MVRVHDRLVLIDLDAAAAFGGQGALKFSSGCLFPTLPVISRSQRSAATHRPTHGGPASAHDNVGPPTHGDIYGVQSAHPESRVTRRYDGTPTAAASAPPFRPFSLRLKEDVVEGGLGGRG